MWQHLRRMHVELPAAGELLAAKAPITFAPQLTSGLTCDFFWSLGSYFARDASYSHEYCSSHSGRYSMFVARVLVGDFVQGNPEYLRPPPRAINSNRLYDSCVDDPTDPSIFVIFEKHQIYPAYILEYSSEFPCMIL